MGIGSLEAAVVADPDVYSVAALASGIGNASVARSVNRRPRPRREIDPSMHPCIAQNGMTPPAEIRGQARAVDRSAHQGFARESDPVSLDTELA